MAERYTRLFSLSENLYAEGSPVVVSAGVLSKDNQTGKVIAQLKIKNISDKVIKAARVELATFDTVGQPIGESFLFEYLDLSASRDDEFGQKTPILISETSVRSFNVTVKQIIFSDNTIWSGGASVWQPLRQQSRLETVFNDNELLKQYKIKYGSDASYELTKERDIWHCVCSALNHQQEDTCHKCRKNFAVLNSMNYAQLSLEKDVRINQEIEEQKKLQELSHEKQQKTKRIVKIAAPIVVVLIIFAVVMTGYLNKNNAYNVAIEYLNSGHYITARDAFEELNGFKDSADMVIVCDEAIEELREQKRELYSPYIGTYLCDEGYTITIRNIRISDDANEATVVGENTSYVEGAEQMIGLIEESDNEKYDFCFSYTAGSNDNPTVIYMKENTLVQYYNGYYNYTYTKR